MDKPSSRPVDWETLVQDNERKLYRAALAILGDPHEAEDAVRTPFCAFWSARPGIWSIPTPG